MDYYYKIYDQMKNLKYSFSGFHSELIKNFAQVICYYYSIIYFYFV
jgi:type IV secretory pathway VirB6-like protein